ncbi:DUF4166 domain-containing protein [Ideonella sp. BN130291]|uniref:DUF4166 domain-containing protein n=1 Tax=Ideonella sp. BN130291 TaxID=3112940 RepID=UPI002E263216|nr:DUF4166 domain-containing protein [Ideonella sp. BN130291]
MLLRSFRPALPLPGAAAPTAPTAPAPAPLDLRALLGEAAWAGLPAAVQRRFVTGHPSAVYVGRMALHCSWVGRLFAGLSRLVGAPLTAACQADIPAVVSVHGNGRGGVVWERRFGHPGAGGATVRSTKELAPDGTLFERTDGGLGMALRVFEREGSLVFQSRRYELVLGRRRWVVPALFTPGTCEVSHTDLGHGRFRFTLQMRHPLWGRTFFQTGVFTDPVDLIHSDATT